jgi:pyridoxamine 5'-phosphate oxidase
VSTSDVVNHADGDLAVAGPMPMFEEWMRDAEASEPSLPNAASLATATPDGRPSLRMVLLKGADDRGFVFYTNLESRKGRELEANPRAALCFHWKSLTRQVRVEGRTEPVSDDEADAYFGSRDRESRIGAWASRQSRPLTGRFELEREVARYAARYALGAIPRPPFWSGFRIVPEQVEFWSQRAFRLHDRLVFARADGGPWTISRLFP